MMFTILTGADVFAPESIGRPDILIGGSRILAISEGLVNSLRATLADVRVIELAGTSITPGLIDSHFHPLGGGDLAGPDHRRGPADAAALLRHGITSGVGVLAADTVGRTVAGLHMLGQEWERSGFTLFHYCGSVSDPTATITGSVERDLIHILPCYGVKMAISDPLFATDPAVMAETALSALRGARRSGKRGIVHLHVGSQSTGLDPLYTLIDQSGLPESVFQPTHINRKEPDLMAAAIPFIDGGGMVDLTASLPLGGGPDDRLDLTAAWTRLLDLGASADRITFSSDGNVTIPERDAGGDQTGWLRVDVPVLVDAWRGVVSGSGRSFSQVLMPVTRNPAAALGIAHRKGTIAVDADADLVAWTDDLKPLLVVAAGQVVVDER